MRPSDYESFIQTEALLSLQRDVLCARHADMMSFIVVHQSTELWLKLAAFEMQRGMSLLRSDGCIAAAKILRNLNSYIDTATSHLSVLDRIPPVDYHAMRYALGNGSGFSSPGWKIVRKNAEELYDVFENLLKRRSLSTSEVYSSTGSIEFQIAEDLVNFDSSCLRWRHRHVLLVERLLGADAVGTAGTPLSILRKLSGQRLFPELWKGTRLGVMVE